MEKVYDAKCIGKKLVIEGFLYFTGGKAKDEKSFSECQRYRSKECRARAVTVFTYKMIVYRGPNESPLEHPANFDECTAEEVKNNLKRKAERNPGLPPFPDSPNRN